MAMFFLRGVAPDSRTLLWHVLCPANTTITITKGEAELDPGEMVSAYEVACVGNGAIYPLEDVDLLLLETGFAVGLALLAAMVFGLISARRNSLRPALSLDAQPPA